MSSNKSDDTSINTTHKVNYSNESRTSKRFRENSPYNENKNKNIKFDDATVRAELFKLYTAVLENDVEKIPVLLKNGIGVNETLDSTTAIFSAIDKWDGGCSLKCLMKTSTDKYKEKINVSPLHLSVIIGNIDVVNMLIEHGADVNCPTKDLQLTPLHLASIKCDLSNVYNSTSKGSFDEFSLVNRLRRKFLSNINAVSVIELLVGSGADVNARDSCQNTALHFATLQSDKNVIETLLKLGAYVDVMNIKGNLPLHNVVESFNVEGLTCLLEFGADINDVCRQFQGIREYESSQVNAFCNSVLEFTNKLRAADLSVANIYKSDFHKSFWLSYRAECLQEVGRLKTHLIADNVSLYEFLHMSIRRRRAYVQYVPLDLEMKFPKYYGIVYGSYRQAVVRRSLIELAKMVWYNLTEINLPDVCFEQIFSYLDNTNLTFFIAESPCLLTISKSM